MKRMPSKSDCSLIRCLWSGHRAACLLFTYLLAGPPAVLLAQETPFDASWYDPSAPYLKVGVVEDGMYQLTGQALSEAGIAIGSIDPATFRLFDRGKEVPLHFVGAGITMGTGDYLAFLGQRNTGEEEGWAYNDEPDLQSSTYYSLYTDTTFYWLTWGDLPGQRYHTATAPSGTNTVVTALRDTLHRESDFIYHAGEDAGMPFYTHGEGYYWSRLHVNTEATDEETYDAFVRQPSTSNRDTLFVWAQLKGETLNTKTVSLSLELLDDGIAVSIPVDTTTWSGSAFDMLYAAIPQDQLPPSGNLRPRLTLINTGETLTNVLIDWLAFSYVRQLYASEGQLHFVAEAADTYSFVTEGFTGTEGFAYSIATQEVLPVTFTAGAATIAHATPGNNTYWVTETSAFKPPATAVLTTPATVLEDASAINYVILTTPLLTPSAEQQAAYRQSAEGGGYTVRVINVEEVFDVFDYGRPTPLAIRRFVRHIQNGQVASRFLMVWGDGLYPDRLRARHPWEVPSFGQSASDGWFAMQQGGALDLAETMAVGRLPVRTNEEGNRFVDKVTSYEAAPFEAWQKRSMFLVGGSSSVEKTVLQRYAIDWSDAAAEGVSSLDTLHFFKSTSDVLDLTFKDSLNAAFQEGVSWLTYFGHSAAQTWEIVTAPPAEFDNAERLPVVLSLGCFTGDFAQGDGSDTDILSFSEQLVFQTLNGAIAHWGASASGTIGASGFLSDEVHEVVYVDTLRTLGTIFQVAKARFLDRRGTSSNNVKHLLQYGLIGDPATRVSLPVRPDFNLAEQHLRITPATPLPADSALTVTIAAQNYGLRPADSLSLELIHHPPTGTATTYAERLPPFGLEQEVLFTIPIDDTSIGEHRFVATLDPEDTVEEEEPFNNSAERTHTVFTNGLTVLSPPDFGLLETITPTLSVTLSRPLVAQTPVVFELDTTPAFDAPLTHQTTTTDLVAQWQPGNLNDGTTYHWRARLDTDTAEGANWQGGTFTIRTDLGYPGFIQQGDLFDANTHSSFLERADGAWRFKTFTIDVTVSSERPGSSNNKGQFVVNGDIYERLGLGFGVLIIDGTNGTVKGHGSMPLYPNNFEEPEAAYEELLALAALVEDGDYILTRTRHRSNIDDVVTIADSVKQVFRDLGSQAIDTLTYNHLWIMLARRGVPAETQEWVEMPGTDIDEITETVTLPFFFGEAQTTSPLIGPALDWQTLDWEAVLPNATSTVRLDVLASDGVSPLLPDLVTAMPTDLTNIDARTHPFIQLRATLTDSSQLATPQLTAWQVQFDPVPELAVDPTAFTITADTVQEGQPFDIEVLVRNLHGPAADTVITTYIFTDAQNQTETVHADTAYQVTTTATSQFTLPTRDQIGPNQILIKVHQPGLRESATFNNVLLQAFVVQKDRVAPEFEVMIDGEQLLHDPDPVRNLQDPALPFVALEPTVEILVDDENPYLSLKGDTTIVSLYLDDTPVPQQAITVLGKRAVDNRLHIRFEPELVARDTTHTLRVEVQDASGNAAEGSPYQVHFRTQTTVAVESVYPYPNPMHSHTVFAFRLRGPDATLVDQFVLRIYTLTGQLIREFDLIDDPLHLEAGILKVGWNKLLWDGNDQDGDPVATGVYLYKVFVRGEGNELDTGASSKVEKVVVIR